MTATAKSGGYFAVRVLTIELTDLRVREAFAMLDTTPVHSSSVNATGIRHGSIIGEPFDGKQAYSLNDLEGLKFGSKPGQHVQRQQGT